MLGWHVSVSFGVVFMPAFSSGPQQNLPFGAKAARAASR